MKTVKFIWATSLCVALGMGLVSCGDDNEEIEPSPEKEIPENSSGHEWVDLGLSVGWATCNVGASSPEEYGDYYAWGETETKDRYDGGTYRLGNSYGTVDNKTVLDHEDDVANRKWGARWRMPTDTELNELCGKCTWIWTTKGGKNGYEVTGPSGNSIFLPAAGYCDGGDVNFQGDFGFYWSSTPDGSSGAYYLFFLSGGQLVDGRSRGIGCSVRAVLDR